MLLISVTFIILSIASAVIGIDAREHGNRRGYRIGGILMVAFQFVGMLAAAQV